MSQNISRRALVHGGASALAILAGCGTETVLSPDVTVGSPRLSARPRNPFTFRLAAGTHWLTVGTVEMLVYMPASARGRGKVPVAVFLHGAGRIAQPFVEGHQAMADAHGVMIVAPYAKHETWDVFSGLGYDKDIAALDLVMQWIFYQVPASPRGLALTGFSDGATYALAVGRANGDLFTRVVAYSPGALIDTEPVGRAPVLVTHGFGDSIASYGVTANEIVPTLRGEGHDVEFIGFNGGHAVPTDVIERVVRELRESVDR